MSFSSTQIKKLQQDLRSDCIRSREVHGRQMSYIEGWHAIAEANRIFGFDAWSRETVESRCVLSRESKGTFHTVYIAKVRITVRTSEASIIREGFGTGDAQAPSAGEAHDKAVKTAETDATKRAFATFGKPFGLSLYLGSRLRPAEPHPPIERRRTEQRLGPSGRYYVPARPRTVIDPALKLPHPSNASGKSADHASAHAAHGANTESGNGTGEDGTSTRAANGRHDGANVTGPANGKSADGAHGGSDTGFAHRVRAPIPAVDMPPRAFLATPVADPAPTSAPTLPNAVEPPSERVAATAAQAESSAAPQPNLSGSAEAAPSCVDPDADPMLITRGKRKRDADHLHFVAKQPCLICNRTPSDPHHLKFAQPQALSRKVSDEFTVPLCRIHHRQLHHGGNEINWWIDMDIDPLPIAKNLWDRSHGNSKKE